MYRKDFTPEKKSRLSVEVPVIAGAIFGLAAISVFVFGGEPDPDWPANWQIKPLVMTPVISAIGGLFYWFTDYLSRKGLNRIIAVILGILGFLAIFWVGMVLGLNGTMWD